MKNEVSDKERIIKYWMESADNDFETMMVMYQSNRFTWSLFIGHLMTEKLLKAFFTKTKGEYPPYIHNLLRLADLSGLPLTKDRKIDLATITAFNINARYDDYKKSFYNKCTPEFTKYWVNKITELRKWLIVQIRK